MYYSDLNPTLTWYIYSSCYYHHQIGSILVDRTHLFVQYTISLSSWCKPIWRHWTYKMPVRYVLSSVWVRFSIFSPLSILQYVGLYVLSWTISLVMIERIYILCLIIIVKSEVWTITHWLGLGHETIVPAVCLSIFLCRDLITSNVTIFYLTRYQNTMWGLDMWVLWYLCRRKSCCIELRVLISACLQVAYLNWTRIQ